MITPVSAAIPATLSGVNPITPPNAPASSSFGALLESYVGRVQHVQDVAQNSITDFLAGGNEELHSVALKGQRASLEFEMFLQLRNKVVDAYQEIMKMQI